MIGQKNFKYSSVLAKNIVIPARSGKPNFLVPVNYNFPERAGMTFVIGQINEELKWDLAYQIIPSKLICQRQKTRAVIGVMIVTTNIGVQSDRYNPPNPRQVDNSRTQNGVTILSSKTIVQVLSVQNNRQ